MSEWERLNSFYLWVCAQPADFDLNAAPNQKRTPAQDEELCQLADIDKWGSTIPRCILYAKIGPPTVGLGKLDELPVEILNHVISSLDVSAVDRFKAINRRGFEVVNAHPQFKIINRQAHDTLRGLRAIKTGHLVTIQTLFEKLCTSQCGECGDYGGYMYLITFERVCCRCFTEKDRYSPLREIEAVKTFGLTLEILRTLPRLQSYPGEYGKYGFKDKEPCTLLIDRASARGAGIARHGSFEAMQEYVANTDPKIWKSYEREIETREKKLAGERALKKREKKVRLKKYNAHKRGVLKRIEEREIRKGLRVASTEGIEDLGEDTDNESVSTIDTWLERDSNSDDDTKGDSDHVRSKAEQTATEAISNEDFGDDYGFRNVASEYRYRAAIRVPWLNRKSGRDEWGFLCVGCEDLEPNHTNREFIMSTFREHLKECGPIRDRVHHTNDCCKKGTCRKKTVYRSVVFVLRPVPFWGG